MAMRLTAVLVLVFLVYLALCENCTYPNDDDLTDVIHSSITAGLFPPPQSIAILDSTVLCLSPSLERDRYRFATVLVEYYSCVGLGTCPNVSTVEQLIIGCMERNWYLIFNASVVANFSTELRQDCASCSADSVTGCLGEYTLNIHV